MAREGPIDGPPGDARAVRPPPIPEPRLSGTPRCLGCGYTLTGLGAAAKCPECAREFDLRFPSTFTYKRPFWGWRYWATGVGVAAGIGLIVIAFDLLVLGGGGASAWIITPVLVGMICGYYARVKTYALPLLGLVLFGAILIGLMSMQLAGVFCGLILACIALVPLLIGALLGHALRAILTAAGLELRKPLVVALLAALALGCALLEKAFVKPAPARTVSTTLDMAAPPERAFDSIMFYEEVKHSPPWILRVGLARPIRTEGSSRAVGDVKTCLYNKGRLVKRVTEVIPNELMAFDVIDQHIGYERDVRLISGSFALAPLDPQHTRVTLSTTYRPLLGPRWAWAWGEDYAIHTLHGHVLEGMRRHAEAAPPAPQLSAKDPAP